LHGPEPVRVVFPSPTRFRRNVVASQDRALPPRVVRTDDAQQHCYAFISKNEVPCVVIGRGRSDSQCRRRLLGLDPQEAHVPL